MHIALSILVLTNPKRMQATDLIVRSSTGMIVAFNNWPAVLRLLEQEEPKHPITVSVRPVEAFTVNR
jgi:hypothetical protein